MREPPQNGAISDLCWPRYCGSSSAFGLMLLVATATTFCKRETVNTMTLPDYRREIQAIAQSRGVEQLLHFTLLENLPSIVEHGLLSRSELVRRHLGGYAVDELRLDGQLEGLSLSVERPNWPMLASMAARSRGWQWVCLGLGADLLWTHACRFCWRNASSAAMRGHRGWCGGPWAFDRMFVGSEEERAGLAASEPTFPDAEVQVLEPVTPEHIFGALVSTPATAARVDAIFRTTPDVTRVVEINSALFA